MQILIDCHLSNNTIYLKKQKISNPQFKAAKRVSAKKMAGIAMLTAGITETAILSRPLYEAKKQQLLYNPEDNFANKSAEKSAEVIKKTLNKRDKDDLLSRRIMWGHRPIFSPEQRAQNKSLFNEYPWALKELLEMKHNKYNLHRFTSYEALYLADTYKENPDGVKELLEMKTEDDEFRFKDYEVVALAEIFKKEPEAVRKLAKFKFKPDYHPEYLSAEDIKNSLEIYKQYPEIIDEIVSIRRCSGEYDFDKDNFLILINLCSKYPDTITQFVKSDISRLFSIKDYGTVIEPCSKYPEAVEELKAMESGQPFKTCVYERFKDKDSSEFAEFVADIAEPYSKYPKDILNLIEMRTKDGKNCRFDNKSVCILAKEYAKNPDYINTIIEMKTPKEALYRFDAKSVCAIAQQYNKNPDYVKKLVEMKTSDGKIYRLDGYFISKFAEKGEKYFDAINELASMDYENGNYRFTSKAIYYLIDTYTQYPDAVKKLAEMKKTDNKFFLFSYKDIAKLAKWYTKYPNYFQEIIDKNNIKSNIMSAEKIIDSIKQYEDSLCI